MLIRGVFITSLWVCLVVSREGTTFVTDKHI